MALRVHRATDAGPVELEELEHDGFTVVADTKEDMIELYARFMRYLQNDTDTFDPVLVEIAMDMERGYGPGEHQHPEGRELKNRDVLRFNEDEIHSLVEFYVETIPGHNNVRDRRVH